MAFNSQKEHGVSRRATAAVVALGVSALILTGCGGASGGDSAGLLAGPPKDVTAEEWDAIVEAANAEGELVFYRSYAGMEGVIEDFQKAYPEIRVADNMIVTGDLIQRLDQEIQAGVKGGDVTMHSSKPWFMLQSKAEVFGAVSVSPDNQADGWTELLGQDDFATLYGFPFTIGYKTENAKPTDLKTLLDADPNLSIGLVDPAVAPSIANAYEALRQTYGDEILDQLAAANYKLEASNTFLSQGSGAGTYDYAYPSMVSTTKDLISKGAAIAEAIPTEAATGSMYSIAILGNAPHPNASMVFMNWMISQGGGESFVKHVSPAALPIKVEGSIAWDTIDFYDPEVWTSEYQDAWIAEHWTPRFG